MSGGSPIGDELVRDWFGVRDKIRSAEHAIAEHLPHHDRGEHPYPDASTETPATPATIGTTTQEEPVINLAELENDAKALAAKFENVDHEAIAKLASIEANPEAMEVFDSLAAVAGVPGLPAGVLSTAGGVLKALGALGQPQAPAETPAPAADPQAGQPQFAGQA